MKSMKIYTDGLEGMKVRSMKKAKAFDQNDRIRPSAALTFESPIEMMRVLTETRLRVYEAVKMNPLSMKTLAVKLHRDVSAVAKDVRTLERYGVVRTNLVTNPGHGRVKIVEAAAPSLRFVTTI